MLRWQYKEGYMTLRMGTFQIDMATEAVLFFSKQWIQSAHILTSL